jgi:hypothetical protein
MSDLIPVLIGTHGLADGEVFMLGDHADLVIGRSRSCEVSFQRFRRFLGLSPSEQKLRDSYNAAVSRRHLRIRTVGTKAILENLSSGGSFCNDARFDTVHEVDLANGPVSLRLGQASEVFKLTLLARANVEAMLAQQPKQPGTGSFAKPQPGVPDPVEDPTPRENPELGMPDAPTPIPAEEAKPLAATIPMEPPAKPVTPPPRPVTPPPQAPAPPKPADRPEPPDLEQSIYL